MAPKGPYKLVTVNKVPARAKIIIGRVVEAVKETYTVDYAANSESTSLYSPLHLISGLVSLFDSRGVCCWNRKMPNRIRHVKDSGKGDVECVPTHTDEKADRMPIIAIEGVKAMCEKEKPDILVCITSITSQILPLAVPVAPNGSVSHERTSIISSCLHRYWYISKDVGARR